MTPLLAGLMMGLMWMVQPAAACGGAGQPACSAPVPTNPSRQAELIGRDACAWTTSMMAQRVLEQGAPWTYVGRLTAASEPLASKVAAPFTVGPLTASRAGGPDTAIHVIANEVLDEIVDVQADARVSLTGKRLEVEGVTYFVVTALTPVRSG